VLKGKRLTFCCMILRNDVVSTKVLSHVEDTKCKE
jgi:hypothetical protein